MYMLSENTNQSQVKEGDKKQQRAITQREGKTRILHGVSLARLKTSRRERVLMAQICSVMENRYMPI